jgi:hypothetical protein
MVRGKEKRVVKSGKWDKTGEIVRNEIKRKKIGKLTKKKYYCCPKD